MILKLGMPLNIFELESKSFLLDETDCLELRLPLPETDGLLRQLPVAVTCVHGPGLGISRPQREQECKEVEQVILFAAEYGIPMVNIHAGITYRNRECRAETLSWLVNSLRRLGAAAAEKNVVLAIENLFKYDCWVTASREEAEKSGWIYPLTAEDMLELIEMVSPVPLAVTYDIGHSLFVRREPWNEIEKLAQHITNIHAHDNDGKSDHLPIDTAGDRFKKIIRCLCRIGYDAPVILEVNKQLSSPLAEIRKLRELEQMKVPH
ncbi:MAG: sugar phosphate isomerase/epimerase family protein [Victivallales bacterium]|jgi:sugar phosphate isomerase/epimerase